jgi:hypothetical protein
MREESVVRELLIQAVGFTGVAMYLISYQMRSNKKLFMFQLMGCLIFLVQFILLGAYTGAVGLAVNILRNLLLLKAKEWPWVKSKITLSALLVLLIGTTALTWDGWISLLPFISISVTCVGYWTDSAKHIRLSQLLGSPWTLVYDGLVSSWGGLISEAMSLASIIISIRRFGWNSMDSRVEGSEDKSMEGQGSLSLINN